MHVKELVLPSNRKFGFFFTAIFCLFSLYFWIEGAINLSYFFLGLCILFFLTSLFKASLLLPLNKFWMKIGYLIGKIINPVVMGVIFFGLFMPISIVMKIFGRDELKLKLKPCESSWRIKEKNPTNVQSFKNQF